MARTVEQAKEKWRERIAGSGKYMKAGVDSPRADWEAEALKAAPKRDAGLTKAIAEGTIDAGIKAAGTEKWQMRTATVGVPRWTSDAPKAVEEFGAGITPVIECVEEAKRKVAAMSETTLEERAEKSKQYQIAMSECMKRKRGF